MRGYCLCGKIEFAIAGDRFKLYQCHCSLCRRQGGSLSNTATIVASENFRWLRGLEFISSWKKALPMPLPEFIALLQSTDA
jgi:hypothetical protein